MSFSADTKKYVTSSPLGEDCCCIAELAAIVAGCGSLALSHKGIAVELAAENKSLYQRVDGILLKYFGVRTVDHGKRTLFNKDIFTFLIPVGAAERVLEECGIAVRDGEGSFSLNDGISEYVVEDNCCVKAYLRGAFLACGYLYIPSSDEQRGKGYLLEWSYSREGTAKSLAALLERLQIAAKVTQRGQKTVVYLRDSQAISDVLAHIGAVKAVLDIQSVRVGRIVRNNTMRGVNCDTYNIARTVSASQRAVAAIEKLKAKSGFALLPESLRETAELRLNEPDLSLGELAAVTGLSKSCIRHRLDKLVELGGEVGGGADCP